MGYSTYYEQCGFKGGKVQIQDGLWPAVLGEIELSVSKASYVTWFKNTQLLKQENDLIVIGAPNIFIKQELEGKFNQLIEDTLKKNGIKPKVIEYKICASPGLRNRPIDNPVVLRGNNSSPSNSPSSTNDIAQIRHKYRQGLNERYTFENFIVGSGNELAYAACQAIAQNPGKKYNPLFLYGGVGIGKTHLIQAVGNAILEKSPASRVVYLSIEQFVQEFIDAVRYKKNTDFAGYYRSADVLILDDIQFIAGKHKTQEEFFHTFNALHQANKQIIISSDKPPNDIPTLEERLKSRFAWGMSIDMQAPEFETRCAIVQLKANGHGVTLPQAVVEYLATNVQTNIRELEGALNQLLAFCEMRGMQPNVEIAASLLGSSKNRTRHLSPKTVVERTAKYFQIPLEDVLGPKRDKDIVVPRQVAMYMLRNELNLSYPKIARELGRKDHTTAIHSVDKITKEATLDVAVRTAINEIKEKLYA